MIKNSHEQSWLFFYIGLAANATSVNFANL